MMLVSVTSLIISFMLQGLMSNFFVFSLNNISIFNAIFLLINFAVLFPFFENDKKMLSLIIIFGLLFDITYSNTLLLSTCIFVLIFYLNKAFNFLFPSNILTVNIFSIISMIIYHSFTFLFLKIYQFDSYNYMKILKVIFSNMIMTVLYTTLLFWLLDFIFKRFNLKKVRV